MIDIHAQLFINIKDRILKLGNAQTISVSSEY